MGDLVTEESFQLSRHQAMKLIRPRWSPDSRFIYYIGRGGGHETLFQIDVLSGLVERLSQENESIRSADPSYDGTRVFYTTDISGSWEVWSLRLEDGMRERIMQMDKDKDGRVSREEFDGEDAMFDRIDRNGDGFIDDKDQRQRGERRRRGDGERGEKDGKSKPKKKLEDF